MACIPGTFLYSYVVAPKEFRWIEWNWEHVRKHGCSVYEVESVVRNAGRGFHVKLKGRNGLSSVVEPATE